VRARAQGHQADAKQNVVLRSFERLFEAMLRAYEWTLDRVLVYKSIMLA